MNPAYRPFVVVLIVAAAMAGFSLWRQRSGPQEHIAWRTTLAEAKKESATTGKPVLAYFTATWCPPCQRMKHETWPDGRVEKALEGYVPVKIDVDQHQDLAQQFEVDGIPRLQVIAPDGTVGKAHVGLILPKELAAWLQAG
jgi:thiol:disulfide interchange protein